MLESLSKKYVENRFSTTASHLDCTYGICDLELTVVCVHGRGGLGRITWWKR